jgi:DNA polymerase-3 subunit gamma/tau
VTEQHNDQHDQHPHPRPPVATPPAPAPPAPAAPDLGEHATGDIVIDSALQDLRDAPEDDLDARIAAGQRVHQTLQGRLSHLGGE